MSRNNLEIKYIPGEKNIPGDVPSRDPRFVEEIKQLDERDNLQRGKDLKAEVLATLTSRRGKDNKSKAKPITEKQINKHVSKRQRKMDSEARVAMMQEILFTGLDSFLTKITDSYATDGELTEAEEFNDKTGKGLKQMTNHDKQMWYYVSADEVDQQPPRLYLPSNNGIREQTMKQFHEPMTSGHVQAKRMINNMKRTYYWKNMDKDINDYAKQCPTCQKNKRDTTKPVGEMADFEDPQGPWMSVAVDFVGPYTKDENGFDMVMVAVCRLTKMVRFVKIKQTYTASDLATVFMDNIFREHGLAKQYRSDRDKWFTSEFWTNVWQQLGTELRLATAYHHQSTGQAERINAELHQYLRMYMDENKNWSKYLTMAEFAYNSSYNTATGCTLFELNKGFTPIRPEDLLTQSTTKVNKSAQQWLSELQRLWAKAQRNLEISHKKNKKYYDMKHRRTKDVDGNVIFAPEGSYVYLTTRDLPNLTTIARESRDEDENMKRKLMQTFIGPFKVLKVCGANDLNRQLELSPTLKRALNKTDSDIFHVSKLKVAHNRPQVFDASLNLPPPDEYDEEGEQIYHVEKIMNYEDRPEGRYFKCRWWGYNDDWNTWEPEWNLQGSKERIKEFFDENKDKSSVNPTNKQRKILKNKHTVTTRQSKRLLLNVII